MKEHSNKEWLPWEAEGLPSVLSAFFIKSRLLAGRGEERQGCYYLREKVGQVNNHFLLEQFRNFQGPDYF